MARYQQRTPKYKSGDVVKYDRHRYGQILAIVALGNDIWYEIHTGDIADAVVTEDRIICKMEEVSND